MTEQEIITELGLDALPEEELKQTLKNIKQTLSMRTMGVLQDMMSNDQKKKFQEISANGNDDETWQWINENIAKTDDVYDALEKDFIADMKARSEDLRNKLKNQ